MNSTTVSVQNDGLLVLPLPKKWAGRRLLVNKKNNQLSLTPINDPDVSEFFEAVSQAESGKTLEYPSMQKLIDDNERHANNKANV